MAYTPIQPLPVENRAGLGALAEGLSYIRQVNEIKRKENEKRKDELIGLLRDVDFPTAMNMNNRNLQMELRQAAEDSLTKILSKSAKRNGQISLQERMEAERVIKTLEKELMDVSAGEQKYNEILGTIAKNPGVYTPESVQAFIEEYLNNRKIDEGLLQYTPIPFSAIEDVFYTEFKDAVAPVKTIQNGREVTNEVIQMDDSERQANYEAIRNKLPGVQAMEMKSFQELQQSDPATFNKYKLPGIDMASAAHNWALNEKATQMGKGRFVGSEPISVARINAYNRGSGKSKVVDVKGVKSEDGGMVYDFSSTPVTVEDEVTLYDDNGKLTKMTLSGAKAFEVGYGKLPDGLFGKYIKVNARRKVVPKDRRQAPYTETGTFVVPYDELSSSIKRKVNLIDIDQFEKQNAGLKKLKWYNE